MDSSSVVSRDQWFNQRRELLLAEKAAMKQLDQVASLRRNMPRMRIEKEYTFETESGPQSLADLFGGKSQLIAYHFMFAPGWEEGCTGCSFVCDHFDGANLHLSHHDVSLVCVSRANLAEFLPFKKRMGWNFPWVSSAGGSFNFDFGASFTPEQIESGELIFNANTTAPFAEELPGLSVFTKDDQGAIYQAYSTFARGIDLLIGAHNLLDLTPNGRNESGVMDWVRHHDRYGVEGAATLASEVADADKKSRDACCSEEESA